MRPAQGDPGTQEENVGAAVEIRTGDIDPVHLKGKSVMLGDTELGVFDGTESTLRFEIPAGRHYLMLKEGLNTSEPVAFLVQQGHCAQLTLREFHADMFSVVFGGWYALKRTGDVVEHAVHGESTHASGTGAPGAQEIPVDEVSAEA